MAMTLRGRLPFLNKSEITEISLSSVFLKEEGKKGKKNLCVPFPEQGGGGGGGERWGGAELRAFYNLYHSRYHCIQTMGEKQTRVLQNLFVSCLFKDAKKKND
jgi:hypothetical protein